VNTADLAEWFVRMPINPRPPQKAGETMRVSLEQEVYRAGHRDGSPPHVCGTAEVLSDGRLRLSFIDTDAGRTAAAMIKDDLLDVVLWNGTVRLRVHNE
jgi:hypothetical protein